MLSFFNDVDVSSDDPQVTAAQYFATKGFFADYNARLDEPLTESARAAWGKGLTAMREGTLKPMELVKAVREAELANSKVMERTRGEALLGMWKDTTAAQLSKPTAVSPVARLATGRMFEQLKKP